MLHEKLLSTQYLMGMKKEHHMYSPQSSPDKIDLYHAYNFNPMHLHSNQVDEVLDLSRRCDSDNRKTPSPYNTPSSSGSPSSQHNESIGLFNPMQSLHPIYYGNSLKQEFHQNSVQTLPAFAQNQVAAAGFLQTMLSQSQEDRMSNTSSPTSSIGAISGDLSKTRPFKAYPRDPLVIAANFTAADVLIEKSDSYSEFRKRGLEQIRGARTISNPRMRRTNMRQDQSVDAISNDSKSENDDKAMESSDNDSNAPEMSFNKPQDITSNGIVKDSAYFERRRKNNAAAKKSRDRRRHKEDEIVLRNAYLERQNIQLLVQIDTLKAQLAAFTKC
uniref:Giant n=1 Tax=Megaselia abdita TaxID=88686 RepID=A0A0B4VKN2_MEGAB|nr:giant [Megaselia abdita]